MKGKVSLFCRKASFVLLLFGSWTTFSLAQNYQVQTYTTADGLSQGMIYDILQDRDGFMWFATKDGLNRFDGYRFEVFTNDPFDPFSIAGNEVVSLLEDKQGNIWMNIGYNRLDMYERSTGRFFHFDAWQDKPMASTKGAMLLSPDGAILVGTEKGLYQINWKEGTQFPLADNADLSAFLRVKVIGLNGDQAPKGNFTMFGMLPDGRLLTSVQGKGCLLLDKEKAAFTPLNLPSEGWKVFAGQGGKLYLLLEGGAFYWVENGNARQITMPPALVGKQISHIEQDGNGNLVFCITNLRNQASFYKVPEAELVEKGFPENPNLIFESNHFSPSMRLDRSGNLWVGTDGFGLKKVNLRRQPFLSVLSGHSIKQLGSIDDAILLHDYGWTGVQLFKLDKGQQTPIAASQVDALSNARLSRFVQTKKGPTYFIADKTEYLSELGNPNWQILHKVAYFEYSPLMEDSRGNVWVGGAFGTLACLHLPSKVVTNFNLSKHLGPTAYIYSLFEKNGLLWIGTTNGLMRLDIGKMGLENLAGKDVSEIPEGQYNIYQTDPENPKSLRYNLVSSICPDPLDPDKYLWVSTKGGGISLLDIATGEFRHFTNKNSGLPNDVVYGILPGDDGNLWMSTNRGLSRLTISPDRAFRFQNFLAYDGLQDDEFNTSAFARTADGRLVFGGINGATIFRPSEIKERQSDASVLITGLKINNLYANRLSGETSLSGPAHLTEQIKLQNTQNLVTIEFALMDFTNPQENRYRYRLIGADPDWVEAGTSHVANYSQLRPGSYTFEVQGSIGGGVWNAKSATLKINILPPWYATWWAYGIYALLLGAGAWSLYQFKLRQNRENAEKKRLQELDEFKSRFFTNITHEFRTPLTVILGMAEQVESEIGKLEIEKSEVHASKLEPEHGGKTISNFQFLISKIGLIRRNGQNLLRLINQILDLSKLESNSLKINYIQGDVLPYLRYISESLHSFANAQNVLVRVESSEPQIVMDYDPERLLQIVHNLLSNAIKFTPSGGRVVLKADLTNFENLSNLCLSVSDTGVGIPPEDLPKIFDRFYQAENKTPHSGGKGAAGGTGIGLSLTKELVKAMGGDISVESSTSPLGARGAGSTFTVRLPLVQSPLTPKGEPYPIHSAEIKAHGSPELRDMGSHLGPGLLAKQITGQEGNPPILQSSNPSILLVEDNPDVVEYLAACLQGTGDREGRPYQLDFAYNGRAGIEKALETVPDLIISDVMMPEKDGFEVCDNLKNDERTSHIPIILLTAKADVESRIAGLKRGADAYLAKPFHQEELLVTLANLLELRRKLQARYASLQSAVRSPQSGSGALQSPPKEQAVTDPEDLFLQKLRTTVEENLSDANLDVEAICKKMGMSHPVIHRKVTALTGRSLTLFVRSIRLAKAKELLLKPEQSISEVAYEVGFNDPKFFSRVFSEEFGESPTVFRQKI